MSGSWFMPDEIMQPYKAQIIKEAVGEILEVLKNQIPADTLATVASSLNGKHLGGINDIEKCQVICNVNVL